MKQVFLCSSGLGFLSNSNGAVLNGLWKGYEIPRFTCIAALHITPVEGDGKPWTII